MKESKEYAKSYFLVVILASVGLYVLNFLIISTIGISITSSLLILLLNLFVGFRLLVRLFADIDAMISNKIKTQQQPSSENVDNSNIQLPDKTEGANSKGGSVSSEVWAYNKLETEDDGTVVIINDGSNEAIFEICDSGITPRSESIVQQYGDEWVDRAKMFLQKEFDTSA